MSFTVELFDLLKDDVVWCCEFCARCDRPLPNLRDPDCEDEMVITVFRGSKIMMIGYHADCWFDREKVFEQLGARRS